MTALCREENIYNLLPVEEEKPFFPPRYISAFRASVKREAQAQSKAPCKTMGMPKFQVPPPKDFLQKHSKTPKLPKRKKAQGSKKSLVLTVPPRTEHPIMGIQSRKNFITANAAEAILQVPRKPARACIDMRKGDRFLIDDSGLVQKYLKKKDFGAVPRYLAKRSKDAKRTKEESDNRLKETLRLKAPQRVTQEEREGLLEGLKQNWEEVNQAFQSMSVAIDTIPRKLYREKLETQMKQLEHDIGILEKHQVIYVANK
ncbi:enkurin-like [Heteronotia binoei]|uniref:enkurin-like n=1 Tax=Heteronotia binoei TaxID=13085 RepID=UPI00292CBAA6|nr:enkurin-like [Heteronotia binoei]